MNTEPRRILSLWQPWASLIALGEKRYETRSWYTRYRGVLYIHAAKHRCSPSTVFNCEMERILNGKLLGTGYDNLPRGCIIARCELQSCLRTGAEQTGAEQMTQKELAFGDHGADRFAWGLHFIERFTWPVYCRGMQGLWTPDAALQAQLDKAEAIPV
jgi:hypothetical protein